MNLTEKLKFPEKAGFCAFSTASNIVYNFKSLFYLFFLTDILGIKMMHAGLIMGFGIVWDAVNDPLVGYYAVNHKFKNGEKIRPFALWCAIPWAFTTILMFSSFNVSYGLKLAFAAAIYFVFELFNTFVAIPYNSMAGLATNRDEDRRAINVARNLGGCLGSGIGTVAIYPLVGLFGGLNANGNITSDYSGRHALFLTAIVMGSICIAGCLVHYFTVKERVKQISDDESHISILDIFKTLFSVKSWILNMLFILCYGILNLLIMTCINYYAKYVIGSSSAATPILAVYLVIAIASSFLAISVDRKLGRRKTMILCCIVSIIGKLWFIISPYSLAGIYVNSLTFAFSQTLAFVMFNTNRNNIADLAEWKGGRRIDSMVSTGDNLITKLAEAGASLLLTGALAAAGYDGNLAVQPESAVKTIIAMLGWVPALVSAVMLVTSYFNHIEGETAQMNADRSAQNA